jgi:hypothetical protein
MSYRASSGLLEDMGQLLLNPTYFLNDSLISDRGYAFSRGFKRSNITTVSQAKNWLVLGFHASVKAGKASGNSNAWCKAAAAYYRAWELSGDVDLATNLTNIRTADSFAEDARGVSKGQVSASPPVSYGAPPVAPPIAPDTSTPPPDVSTSTGGDSWIWIVGIAVITGAFLFGGKKGRK